MTRSLVIPVLVGAIAALGYAATQLNQMTVDISPLVGSATSGKNDPLIVKNSAVAASLASRTLSDYPDTPARPIFFAGRRVPEKPKGKVATTEPMPVVLAALAPPPEPLQLVGVMGAGVGRRVLVRTSLDPLGIWLSVGDDYRGWRLREILGDTAVVEAQGQSTLLRLYVSSVSKVAKR